MNEAAPAIFTALEGSSFAAGVRASSWAYMTANVGHIVFLFVFAGAIAVMDLRLTGSLKATAPGRVVGGARRVAMVAFGGMVVTGFVLFAAEASHVALNPVFQVKAALIALGLLNVAWFQFAIEPRIRDVPPLAPLPSAARVSGFVSIGVWLCVAICGRSIAYF
jgi:hypothetical protein